MRGGKSTDGIRALGEWAGVSTGARRSRWVAPVLAKLRKPRQSFAMAAYDHYQAGAAKRRALADDGEMALMLESGKPSKGSRFARSLRLWMLTFRPTF